MNERTDIRITIYPRNFVCGGYNNGKLQVYSNVEYVWIQLTYLSYHFGTNGAVSVCVCVCVSDIYLSTLNVAHYDNIHTCGTTE